MQINKKRIACLFLTLLLFASDYLCATNEFSIDKGVWPIKNFSSNNYNGLPPNWCILEDSRGLIYVANLGGGLNEYDGTHWRKVSYANNSPQIRSITIDKKGVIYVGSVNDFGYIKANANGL